jgi:hypothetical protein
VACLVDLSLLHVAAVQLRTKIGQHLTEDYLTYKKIIQVKGIGNQARAAFCGHDRQSAIAVVISHHNHDPVVIIHVG